MKFDLTLTLSLLKTQFWNDAWSIPGTGDDFDGADDDQVEEEEEEEVMGDEFPGASDEESVDEEKVCNGKNRRIIFNLIFDTKLY